MACFGVLSALPNDLGRLGLDASSAFFWQWLIGACGRQISLALAWLDYWLAVSSVPT